MRLYTFYLSVALLAFGSGWFVVFAFCMKTTEQSLAKEKKEKVETITPPKIEDEEIKYGCRDKELLSFWEKLDKEKFLSFKRQEIKMTNTEAGFTSFPKSPESFKHFEEEWKQFQRDFNCSYFGGIEKEIDLNNDGINELFVAGEFSMRNGETFVFKEEGGRFKLILNDGCNIEREIKESKTNGYFDIVFMTNFSGGNRTISHYQFDGKAYKAKRCFAEEHLVKRNEEMLILDKAEIRRTACNQLSNIVQ